MEVQYKMFSRTSLNEIDCSSLFIEKREDSDLLERRTAAEQTLHVGDLMVI